jgi:dTDP-4-dehydrorhamnose reductase
MRLLVIGGSGLVGSQVVRAARAAGHTVVGTYRSHPLPGLVPFDGADEVALATLLRVAQPDAAVHAAGWTWVDGCEDNPARALEENAHQPERLARACHAQGIHVTYCSTSYIFDGQHGPYDEEARPNPINVYARSKWEGEQRVQAACSGTALVPRVICVYGAEPQGKNFACQLWRAMIEGRTMRLPADQRGNPSYAGDLARWLVALAERRERGVWNLAGPLAECTRPQWADMLIQGFAACGIRPNPGFGIDAVPTSVLKQKARRPLHAGMLTHKITALGLPPTEFAETVQRLVLEQPPPR